jgi:hypothetical protein
MKNFDTNSMGVTRGIANISMPITLANTNVCHRTMNAAYYIFLDEKGENWEGKRLPRPLMIHFECN